MDQCQLEYSGRRPNTECIHDGYLPPCCICDRGGVVCRDTTVVTVTGNTTPPGATATGSNINCISTTATLHGNSGTSGVNYLWTGPGISPANQNLQNPTVNVAGQYILTVTNPTNGCTSTATVTVMADNTPPSAGVVGGNITCLQSNVTLDGSTNIPNPTWNWAGPGINGSNQGTENPNVNVAGTYTVSVTNSINGCVNTATTTVIQDVAIPTASAGADNTLTCLAPASISRVLEIREPRQWLWAGQALTGLPQAYFRQP